MNDHGCSLLLEGAQRAASKRLRNVSGATYRSAKARGLQRLAMSSWIGNSAGGGFFIAFSKWKLDSQDGRKFEAGNSGNGRMLLRGFLDHFQVDGDVDVVADHHAAAVDVGVPLHAIVLAVDFRGGAGGDPGVAPGIFHRIGRALYVENHFLAHAVNGQVSGDFELAGRDVLNLFGLEGNGGVFGGVEELFTAEILVALGFAGIDGLGVDGDVDHGFADVLIVPNHRAVHSLELAAHGRNHEVPYGEAGGGVRGL